MFDDILRLGDDGMVHRWEHVYGGRYCDAGLYETVEGNCVAWNQVFGGLNEVSANRVFDVYEGVGKFSPEGKDLRVKGDSKVVVEVVEACGLVLRERDFVPSL